MANGENDSIRETGRDFAPHGELTGRASAAAIAALRLIAAQSDADIDLAEAALVLASFDHPASDLDVYRDHLRELNAAVHRRVEALDHPEDPAPEEMAQALADTIAGEFRYCGDEETYDDLDNANLMRVIERRKGLPVALGVLYVAAARGQGWAAAGLNFPGHFLVRVESADGRRVILDPFHGGRIMETPQLRELLKIVAEDVGVELEASHYSAVSDRDILVRLQNNVRDRLMKMGLLEGALEALLRMQILCPHQAILWRDAGVMHMRLGRLKHAIEAFEGFVSRSPHGEGRDKIVRVIQELRERLH